MKKIVVFFLLITVISCKKELSKELPDGCSSKQGYSTTTGQPCDCH